MIKKIKDWYCKFTTDVKAHIRIVFTICIMSLSMSVLTAWVYGNTIYKYTQFNNSRVVNMQNTMAIQQGVVGSQGRHVIQNSNHIRMLHDQTANAVNQHADIINAQAASIRRLQAIVSSLQKKLGYSNIQPAPETET